MGYVGAARGREMMRTMGNSGAAILSKIVESIGKTAIRRAVSLLFVLGGVVVSVGLASYIWINKKLKQIEEQQDTITSKLKQIEERQNEKLDKQAKIQEDQNIKFNKFEVWVDHHMQRINDVIVERDKDNSRAALSKLKEDFDQQLQNTEESQKQMKEELQTQIKQQEHNVIKNNGTLDKKLDALEKGLAIVIKNITTHGNRLNTIDEKHTKQQEDIKKEMSTYIHQQLNTLEKELPAAIVAGFPDALSKLKKDFDQQLQNTEASQAQMKEELQTQIKQQEHNVITNITGTIDERLNRMDDLLSKIYQCAEALTVERGCPGKIINGGHEIA